MSIVILTLLKTVVFPMLAGGLIALGLSKWRGSESGGRDWVVGLALLMGFAVGFAGVAGLSLKPVLVRDWLPYTGLIGLAAMLLVAPLKAAIKAPAVFLAAALPAWIHLKPLAHSYEGAALALLIGAVTLIWFSAWIARDWASNRLDAKENLLGMVVAATAVSLVSVLDGSVIIGQLAGSLAATAGSLFLVRLIHPALVVRSVTNGVFTALFGGLLINAWFYVEVSPAGVLLALATVFAMLPVRLPFYRTLGDIQRQAVVVVTALLPTIAAVVYLLTAASNDGYY